MRKDEQEDSEEIEVVLADRQEVRRILREEKVAKMCIRDRLWSEVAAALTRTDVDVRHYICLLYTSVVFPDAGSWESIVQSCF